MWLWRSLSLSLSLSLCVNFEGAASFLVSKKKILIVVFKYYALDDIK